MKRLAIIDNYDSFTYNLVHLIEPMVDCLDVMRNDQIDHDILSKCEGIILSPGPGLPNQTNDLISVLEKYQLSHNILGVCLGHQTIAEFFGGNLENLVTVKHGISTKISVLDSNCIYKNLPNSFYIGHYHSWIVKDLTKDFYITARDETGEIMSFRHKNLKLFGIQYHPESILTEHGTAIMQNWINQTIK